MCADVLAEPGVHDVERARARQVDPQVVHDPARARRHHEHPVGEEHRLGDRVGDEQHGLLPLHPDALQLDVHVLARHGVERAERLVHQQHGRIVDQGADDARPAAACRPRAPADSGARSRRARRASAGPARPSACIARGRGPARRRAAARCRARCARETARATGTRRRYRGAAPSMGVPRSSASPGRGGRMPARILSSVDLPQPEGPDHRDELAFRHGEGDAVQGHHVAVPGGVGLGERADGDRFREASCIG